MAVWPPEHPVEDLARAPVSLHVTVPGNHQRETDLKNPRQLSFIH